MLQLQDRLAERSCKHIHSGPLSLCQKYRLGNILKNATNIVRAVAPEPYQHGGPVLGPVLGQDGVVRCENDITAGLTDASLATYTSMIS
jgi:hypothetical protein